MPIRFFLAWDDVSSSDCDTESQSLNETCDADDVVLNACVFFGTLQELDGSS